MRELMVLLSIFVLAACNLLRSGDKEYNPEIVFSAEDKKGTPQIYTMNGDGSNVTKLTNWKEGSVQPSWSPDGKTILFSSFRKSTSIGPGMWVMKADGSNKHSLYEYQLGGNGNTSILKGRNARWSPDGKHVVFDLCPNCQLATNYDIYVFDTQTEEATKLTEHLASDTNPEWSPDGTRIVFVSNRDYVDADTLRFRKDLYAMNSDGSNLKRITETGNATNPNWSPDGTKIAYEWNVEGNDVFIYDLVRKEITEINVGLEFSGNPLWNKDGTQLVVFGREFANTQPEMRLVSIVNDSSKLLQTIRLSDKSIGRNYDWNDKD